MGDRKDSEVGQDSVSSDLLKRALDGGGVGTWKIDFRQSTIFLDAQDAALLGLEPRAQTLPNEQFVEMIHPDDREDVEQEYLLAREKAEQYELECRFIRPNGEVCWLIGRGIFLQEDDELVGMAGVHFDVSDHHRIQNELRESRRRLYTLMSNLPGMAYRGLNDPTWPLLFVSEGAEMLCGYTAEELVSEDQRWLELIYEEDRLWLWEHVQEAIRERRPFKLEYRIRHADGGLRWVWEQGRAIFEHDEVVALEGFITDVTARKRAEEELREADRQKDQFLALLGHELRNPVTAIISASEFLRRSEHQDPAFERIQGVLERQSAQMKRLIDSLLDISRIARGKIRLDKRTLELGEVLRGLLDDRESQLSTRHLETSLDGEAWVEADSVRISQVFENLLMNAVKFTDETDTIMLDMKRTGDEVQVSVRDTGEGIDPDLIASIFEPFRQAPKETAESSEGLGLGLALVKGLVELHGGRVEAHSGGKGKGATFVVCLPLVEPAPKKPDKKVTPKLARRQILLVEDDPDIAEVLTLLLERVGHDSRITTTVSEGLAAVAESRPDLVMCDLGLPGQSGYAFAEAIRADEELHDLPLVALTGFGSKNARGEALEAGFDEFLTKPVGMAQLAEVCARLCTKPDE